MTDSDMQTIEISSLWAFLGDNHSRELTSYFDLLTPAKQAVGKEDEEKLSPDIVKLATAFAKGVKLQLGGMVMVTKITKAHASEALDLRRKLRAQLAKLGSFTVSIGGADVAVANHHLMTAFDAIYPSGAKAKEPAWETVAGFRRTIFGWLLGNAVRAAQGLELFTTVPVEVKVYTADARGAQERRVDNIMENTNKADALKKLTNEDMIKAANDMFESGCKEAALTELFKRGTAQKLYGICKLNQAYPELNLVERLRAGELKWGPLHKEQLRDLITKHASEDEVRTFFETPPGTNVSGMAPRKDIEKLLQYPCEIVRLIARFEIKNDVNGIGAVIGPHRVAIDKALKAIFGHSLEAYGKGVEVDEVVQEESADAETEEKKAKKVRAPSRKGAAAK
ncbi:MAG: hypothetical protein ACSLE5_11690 [Porticoccaceae bacterium]